MSHYFSSATPSGISYCIFGTQPIFVSCEVHVPDLVFFPTWFSLLELPQLLTLQKFQEKENFWTCGLCFFLRKLLQVRSQHAVLLFCLRKFYCLIITSVHLAHIKSISLSFNRESKQQKRGCIFHFSIRHGHIAYGTTTSSDHRPTCHAMNCVAKHQKTGGNQARGPGFLQLALSPTQTSNSLGRQGWPGGFHSKHRTWQPWAHHQSSAEAGEHLTSTMPAVHPALYNMRQLALLCCTL